MSCCSVAKTPTVTAMKTDTMKQRIRDILKWVEDRENELAQMPFAVGFPLFVVCGIVLLCVSPITIPLALWAKRP